MPHTILTTIGARTGKLRSLPLLCVRDGDRVVLIASNGGGRHHPAWYHNLRANPVAWIEIDGRTSAYTSREAEGDERARLWALATDLYAGYDAYQALTQRRIPVMVLEPAPPGSP